MQSQHASIILEFLSVDWLIDWFIRSTMKIFVSQVRWWYSATRALTRWRSARNLASPPNSPLTLSSATRRNLLNLPWLRCRIWRKWRWIRIEKPVFLPIAASFLHTVRCFLVCLRCTIHRFVGVWRHCTHLQTTRSYTVFRTVVSSQLPNNQSSLLKVFRELVLFSHHCMVLTNTEDELGAN